MDARQRLRAHLPFTWLWLSVATCGCGPSGCQAETLGVTVTGGANQGFTPDYEQAETVVTVTRVVSYPIEDVVTISFNDRTENPRGPLVVYPTPEERTVYHGASLMGWSYSLDDGSSFTYGGKVFPPVGWAVLWGDPAITTVGLDGPVYLANLAGSDRKWPESGELVNQTMQGHTDGFCIARSIDGGVSFPAVKCFKMGTCHADPVMHRCIRDDQCFFGCDGAFYDGNELAAFDGYVYYASENYDAKAVEVWRAEQGTLDFRPFVDTRPFDDYSTWMHPRFRVFGNRLYVVAQISGGQHMATYLQAGSTLWATPRIVSHRSPLPLAVKLSDRKIGFANQFSFDLGYDADSQRNELRILYTRRIDSGKLYLHVVLCDADLPPSANDPALAQCWDTGWTTKDTPGDQFAPQLYRNISEGPEFAAPVWKAVWLSREADPQGNLIEVRHANLATVGGVDLLVDTGLVAPQVPCSASDPANPNEWGYWGEYNDLTQLIKPTDLFDSPRFITPFTRNGAEGECDFRTKWTADMHVGAVVFQ